MKAEERAAGAEAEKRDEAAGAARLAAQLSDARRVAKAKGDEAAQLAAALEAARGAARAADEAAKRERGEVAAEWGRQQQELANERSKVAAAEERAARCGGGVVPSC